MNYAPYLGHWDQKVQGNTKNASLSFPGLIGPFTNEPVYQKCAHLCKMKLWLLAYLRANSPLAPVCQKE